MAPRRRRSNAGKGGQVHLGRPVFNTVKEAVEKNGSRRIHHFCTAGIRSRFHHEAAEAGIEVIVAITEGIPVKDMMVAKRYIKDKARA